MAVGLIPTVVRIGSVIYQIIRTSNKFPKTTRVLRRQGASEGAQIGAGLGSFVANVEYFYQEIGLIGVPETPGQRQYNRFGKTRSKVFKSARNRRCRPRSRYRYR